MFLRWSQTSLKAFVAGILVFLIRKKITNTISTDELCTNKKQSENVIGQ